MDVSESGSQSGLGRRTRRGVPPENDQVCTMHLSTITHHIMSSVKEGDSPRAI